VSAFAGLLTEGNGSNITTTKKDITVKKSLSSKVQKKSSKTSSRVQKWYKISEMFGSS